MNGRNKVQWWPDDDITPSERGNALAIIYIILYYITERPYMQSAYKKDL